MVDFKIQEGIRPIGDKIITTTAKAMNAEWFAEDITILLSNNKILTTIVVDFSYSISSIIQYTLDSGATWASFNQNVAVFGGQSRFIRVTNDVKLNFRADTAGDIHRIVVSIP